MKHLLAALALGLTLLGAAPARAASYAIDSSHTFIYYEVLHLGMSTSRGRFDKSEGTLEFDRGARTGKVDITIDMRSVSTGLAALDKELRGDKFFDTGRFPTARFAADRFSFAGDKVAEVSGELTLLGKTQPVTLRAVRFNCYLHPFLKVEACGGDFEATVARSRWGMGIYGPDMIAENVRLVLQIEALKQ